MPAKYVVERRRTGTHGYVLHMRGICQQPGIINTHTFWRVCFERITTRNKLQQQDAEGIGIGGF